MAGGHTFVIRSARSTRFVPEAEVLWIEAVRHYVRLHLEDGTTLYRSGLGALERELEGRFVRVHRSYLVRRDQVRRLTREDTGRYSIHLASGDDLPVGDTYLRSARIALGA